MNNLKNEINIYSTLLSLSILAIERWNEIEDFFDNIDYNSLEYAWIKSLINLCKEKKNNYYNLQNYSSLTHYLLELEKKQKAITTLNRQINEDYTYLYTRYSLKKNNDFYIIKPEDLNVAQENLIINFSNNNNIYENIIIKCNTKWLNIDKHNIFKNIYEELLNNKSEFSIILKEKNKSKIVINNKNINIFNNNSNIINKILELSMIFKQDLYKINDLIQTPSYIEYNKERKIILNLLKITDTNFFQTPNFSHLDYLNKYLINNNYYI